MGANPSGEAGPAVRIEGIAKRFGPFTALADVSFSVDQGQAFALLGPNGAGKTTLIRLVAGLAKPSRGTIRVQGIDLAERPDLVRRRIGVISHQTMCYDDLTAAENLRFYGKLYGLSDLDTHVARSLETVGLSQRAGDLFRTFSRGMKQRLAIARATIHEPSILLLDEPFTGLDASARDMLAKRIRGFKAEGRTILLVTHDLGQALDLADRFVLLRRGHIVSTSTTASLSLAELESRYAALADTT